MNPYIKTLTDELIHRYIANGINDVKLIEKVKENIYDIKSEKDKLEILRAILEANELQYQEHLKVCEKKDNCLTNKKHLKVSYFLQQELEELGVLATDNFTWEEKSKCNEKLDEILQTIKNSNDLIYEKLEILSNEIKELKNLYVLGKKNWKQQFAGKMSDMVFSGVISELTAKPLIESVFKPGVEFVIGGLLNS